MDDSEDELIVNRSNCRTYSRNNSYDLMDDEDDVVVLDDVQVKKEPLDQGKPKLCLFGSESGSTIFSGFDSNPIVSNFANFQDVKKFREMVFVYNFPHSF